MKRTSSATRIAEYCGVVFPTLASKSAAKKAITAGHIFLNGKKARTADFVKNGDLIELRGSAVRKIKRLDYHIPIEYQDPHLLIVNKPGGIAVNGNRYKTVENGMAHIPPSTERDALPRPIAVHRLDVPTCGLVVLARTKSAQIKMGKLFQSNRIRKEYIAIVHGTPTSEGEVNSAIQDKTSLTKYQVLRSVPSRIFGSLSLIRLLPITGRTHQLRIHLKSIGHLIVGDKMYADGRKTILGKGLQLCATQLIFAHPVTQDPLSIRIEPPAKFSRILDREAKRSK